MNAHALSRRLLVGIAVAAALAGPVRAQDEAGDLYQAALRSEQTARAALASDDGQDAVLAEVRHAVAAYEEIVRRFPRSGYCDNALWNGGVLSLDAYDLFGATRDKSTGTRLLQWLQKEYPHSRLLAGIPAQLTRATRDQGQIALIKRVDRTILPEGVRVTIHLNAEVPFHEEWLDSPPRLYIDFASTHAAATLRDRTIRFDGDTDVVHQIRLGRHANNTTRVVLDAQGVADYSVYPLYDPFTLVVDVTPSRSPVHAASFELPDRRRPPVAVPAGVPPALPATVPAPAPAVPAALPAAALTAPMAAALPVPPPPEPPDPDPAPVAPQANGRGGFSFARQLGLGIARIVIDPGHGGHDPGAQANGVSEAELVLDVALRLEKLLKKTPGLDVVLTRRTDTFVPLEERTAIANREGADLFLSIHANASTNTNASGIETYFLNFATTLGAKAVAARENAASGETMGDLPDFVRSIALNNKLDESRDFATEVQTSLVEHLRASNKSLKDLGVKQAPFVVLIGAAMPSVLSEISFVTNPQEAKLLKTGAYRQRIAEALYNALIKYQMSLGDTQTVAQQ
jgi:N-acetylmuramoyl-L-alanine amidase